MADYPSKRKYDQRMMRHFGLKLHWENDADIIEALDSAYNKQDLIRRALRAYLAGIEIVYEDEDGHAIVDTTREIEIIAGKAIYDDAEGEYIEVPVNRVSYISIME